MQCSADQVINMLNTASGVMGISGKKDMRDIEKMAEEVCKDKSHSINTKYTFIRAKKKERKREDVQKKKLIFFSALVM